MKIRPANNDDRESIEALIFPILRSYGLEPSEGNTDADLQDIERHYFGSGGRFDVLVNEDDVILGTVAICQTTSALCELRKMYLASSLRRQGWGKRLLDHALSVAREMGYTKIWLETAHTLTNAHALYLRNGFQPFDGPHCSSRCDFALVKEL
ncbi:MAG: GNAT family N-acetyltransferase [Verrucomicrobiota bacterium]